MSNTDKILQEVEQICRDKGFRNLDHAHKVLVEGIEDQNADKN